MRPRPNFTDDILQSFVLRKLFVLIYISLKIVPKDKLAISQDLLKLMAWHPTHHKPLSEQMMDPVHWHINSLKLSIFRMKHWRKMYATDPGGNAKFYGSTSSVKRCLWTSTHKRKEGSEIEQTRVKTFVLASQVNFSTVSWSSSSGWLTT